MTLTCHECKKTFPKNPRGRHRKYCYECVPSGDNAAWHALNRGRYYTPVERTTKTCGWCGSAFQVVPGWVESRTWCSDTCREQLRRLETYDLSVDEYARIMERQSGVCAICGGIPNAIDHDHKTSKVRGVLCRQCNRGMGLLGDDPVRLQAAVVYLKAFA